ncbi:hypothetical protein HZR84_07255 [Hyphobacterium sp. CCMP332]|nr:hypothetical protein HZR84_07255 [Hyphobacterium sp. CCMP332]
MLSRSSVLQYSSSIYGKKIIKSYFFDSEGQFEKLEIQPAVAKTSHKAELMEFIEFYEVLKDELGSYQTFITPYDFLNKDLEEIKNKDARYIINNSLPKGISLIWNDGYTRTELHLTEKMDRFFLVLDYTPSALANESSSNINGDNNTYTPAKTQSVEILTPSNVPGNYLIKAGKAYNAALGVSLVGGLIGGIAIGIDSPELALIAIGGSTLISLILNVTGNNNLIKEGMMDQKRISMNTNQGIGIAYTF